MNVKLLRAEWRAVRRASLRLMHHSLSMVGLLSVGIIALVATHPEYARTVGRWVVPGSNPSPVPPAAPQPDPLVGAIVHPSGEVGRLLGLTVPDPASTAAVLPDAAVTMNTVSVATARPGLSREQRDITSYLSRKYRVNGDAIAMLVDAAYATGKDLSLDPLLLLSVMGVESGFNPFAESTAGASGLMQLIAKVHRDKLNDFGGPNIALNPVVNLRVGAVVLKDCIRRGGSIADGLRLYVGAGNGVDGGYGVRVLQEKDKLAQAVRDGGHPRSEARVERRTEPGAVDPSKTAGVAHDAAQGFGGEDRPDEKVDAHEAAHEADRAADPDHGRFSGGRVASL